MNIWERLAAFDDDERDDDRTEKQKGFEDTFGILLFNQIFGYGNKGKKDKDTKNEDNQ
jgi:hypothetical protein